MPVPDFSPGEVLTAAAMDSIGLWKVATATATSGTTLTISNCFSADYDAYRVVMTDVRLASRNSIAVQLENSGGLSLTDYYYYFINKSYATSSVYAQVGAANATSFAVLGGLGATVGGGGYFEVFNPFLASNKTVATAVRLDPITTGTAGQYFGYHDIAASYTGLHFVVGATITNMTATVYGYRK
jgi:hypothetical protein